MGAAVAVTRSELTPAQLRAAACAAEASTQVRRLLAIALVLEGVPRQQAAAQCGMDRQTDRAPWGGVGGRHRNGSQLAAKHGIHQTMVGEWKRHAVEGLVAVFSGKGEEKEGIREEEVEKLHAKIGQLVVERDFLAKASGR